MRWLRRLLRRPEPQPDPRFHVGVEGSPGALLKAMFGATPTATGGGPYTHTYTPAEPVVFECQWCSRELDEGEPVFFDDNDGWLCTQCHTGSLSG